jgi:hypothetical protein
VYILELGHLLMREEKGLVLMEEKGHGRVEVSRYRWMVLLGLRGVPSRRMVLADRHDGYVVEAKVIEQLNGMTSVST